MPRSSQLVRYVSPFGSPATLVIERAQSLLAEDTEMWKMLDSIDALTETQRRVGAPRLDDPAYRSVDLPVWVDGDGYDTIQELVRVAEQKARDSEPPLVRESARRAGRREYVVVSRDGKSTVIPRRMIIDGDDERWSTETVVHA